MCNNEVLRWDKASTITSICGGVIDGGLGNLLWLIKVLRRLWVAIRWDFTMSTGDSQRESWALQGLMRGDPYYVRMNDVQ